MYLNVFFSLLQFKNDCRILVSLFKKKKNRRREKQDAEILIDNRITNVHYNIFIVIFNILHAYKITVKKYLIRRTLIRRNKD